VGGVLVLLQETTARHKAELALKRSETLYRGVFEHIAEEVQVWQLIRDVEGRIEGWRLLDANRSTALSWGKSIPELRGKTAEEIWGPGTTEHYLPVVRRIFQTGQAYSYQDYFEPANMHARLTSVALKNVPELGECFITSCSRITPIERLASAAETEDPPLRTFLNAMTDGVTVFSPQGQIVLRNEAENRLYGYDRGEDMPQTAEDFERTLSLVLPGGAELPRELFPYSRVLRGESIVDLTLWVTPEHSDRPRLLRFSGQLLRNARGQAFLGMMSTRDVTSEKLAESRVVDAEMRFRAFMDHVPAAAWAKDAEGRVAYLNRAYEDCFGLSLQSARGRTDRDLWQPERAAAFQQEDAEVRVSGRPRTDLVRRRDARGEERCWLVNKFAYRDHLGAAFVGGFAVDVTAQSQAQTDARTLEASLSGQANSTALSQLAGGIAHNLESIWTGLLGRAALARAELHPEEPAVVEYLSGIERAGARVVQLTENMLAYAGGSPFIEREVDVDAILRTVAAGLRAPGVKTSPIALELSQGLELVRGDEQQLSLLFKNLLAGALAAVSRGDYGSVALRSSRTVLDARRCATFVAPNRLTPGPYVQVQVEDSGPGMDAGTLAQVFDPFSSARSPVGGLGMAAALSIVRHHCGGLLIQSSRNAGTRVTVVLPSAPRASDAATRPQQGAPSRSGEYLATRPLAAVPQQHSTFRRGA
jgi:PAS domain S-box-containing protein